MPSLADLLTKTRRAVTHRKVATAAIAIAGMVALGGGAALAARGASAHLAETAMDKLGGDGGDVLDRIAEQVVKKITEKGGTLDSAQEDIVTEVAGLAGEKLGSVELSDLVEGIREDVVAAGLGKLDHIDTDELVAQVTSALIAQASTLMGDVDVEALAEKAVSDAIKSMNLEALVEEKIDSVDVEELVQDAVAKHLAGSSGTNPLSSLLELLGSRR